MVILNNDGHGCYVHFRIFDCYISESFIRDKHIIVTSMVRKLTLTCKNLLSSVLVTLSSQNVIDFHLLFCFNNLSYS